MTVEQAARDFFGWFNRHYPAPSTNPDHEWNRLGVALVNHQAVTDRQTTHAQGCWSWGPRHYECAVGQIERDEALLRQALEALEQIARDLPWELTGLQADTIAALRGRLGEGEQQ